MVLQLTNVSFLACKQKTEKAEKRGERKGVPTIGNKVWIGANSIVVGGIIIGDNVLIAPGAFVNFNVPSNSLVIGNPGIIKSKYDATEIYIDNLV